MATRLYSITPGQNSVTEAVGSANTTENVELTVNLAATVMEGSTRAMRKEEVLNAIDKIREHIVKGNWLPA